MLRSHLHGLWPVQAADVKPNNTCYLLANINANKKVGALDFWLKIVDIMWRMLPAATAARIRQHLTGRDPLGLLNYTGDRLCWQIDDPLLLPMFVRRGMKGVSKEADGYYWNVSLGRSVEGNDVTVGLHELVAVVQHQVIQPHNKVPIRLKKASSSSSRPRRKLVACHSCIVPGRKRGLGRPNCINPAHLRLDTQSKNMKDSYHRPKPRQKRKKQRTK